jgi:hypothetical protein
MWVKTGYDNLYKIIFMDKKILFIIAVTLLVTACDTKTKYTRSNCISKINLDWKGIDKNRSNVIENAMDQVIKTARNSDGLVAPNISTQYSDYNTMYFQFPSKCEMKTKMTIELMDSIEKMGGFPIYHVSEEVVIPSIHTIDVRGPDWID